uniref:Uncharacterized protein n=1 Tax=Romanomermis culicivorax TaxID=13658 RepID=A0A915IZS8_ROMCU
MALPPIKVLLIGLILSLSGTFHFGYQFTVVNPSENVFKEFLNGSQIRQYGRPFSKEQETFLWTLILNLPNIFALFGTMSSSALMEKLGRKKSFYVMVGTGAFGSSMSGLSYWVFSWELFTIGKVISGKKIVL